MFRIIVCYCFRFGGFDLLDFISMFNNLGSLMEGILFYWYYIFLGLLDFYGDGRVYEYV